MAQFFSGMFATIYLFAGWAFTVGSGSLVVLLLLALLSIVGWNVFFLVLFAVAASFFVWLLSSFTWGRIQEYRH